MSFNATVLKVMIASPGDVQGERAIVRECIYEWNAIHAEAQSLLLLPVGWETHASPSMSAQAQSIINEQVLEGCDLLVGAFWTRLGTPTTTDQSGTAEEIRRHLERGRPAMLYFSDRPVEPSSIDRDQYDALIAFRDACKARGLVETYSSHEEFRAKFSRQLAQAIQREFAAMRRTPTREQIVAVRSDSPLFSHEARVLLFEVSQDSHGTIVVSRALGGKYLQTNEKIFPNEPNPRTEAMWNSALRELLAADLIEDTGYQGEVFQLTRRGWEVADSLGAPRD